MQERSEREVLERIEELLAVIAKVATAEALKSVLSDKKNKLLYDETENLSVKELSKKTGFSAGKISGLWQGWERSGLLTRRGKRYKKVF